MVDRSCSVDGCDRRIHSHGLCSGHAHRLRRHGDPLGSAVVPLAVRFWAKVERRGPDECWPWTGATSGGYGRISIAGRGSPMAVASRVAWELTYGPLAKDQHVCHRCDNPPCVNPAHLFLGNPASNAADKVGKERQVRGVQFPQAKFTENDVREVRARRATGATFRALAEEYGVSYATVWNVINRQTWKHIA